MNQYNKIKVLHCIAALKSGGAEQQLRLLLKYFDRSRYELSVLCLDDELGSDLLPTDVKIIKIQRDQKWNMASLWLRIIQTIYSYQPDLLHLWLPEIVTIPAAIAGNVLQIPILSTHRNSPAREAVADRSFWLRDRAAYLTHFLAQQIVTNFEVESLNKSLFKQLFVWKHGQVIRNAVDLDRIRNLKKNQSLYKEGYFNLIYTGRLVEQKQPDLLVRALSKLVAKDYPIFLHIFGQGPKELELKSLVTSLHLNDYVAFHNFRDDWLEFAKAADLFLLPSKFEGMPNVLLEASATGLTVIAKNIPEISAIFTHDVDAFLVDENSDRAFAEAIELLYKSEKLRMRLSHQSWQTIESFSVQRMTNLYDKLYQKMLQ